MKCDACGADIGTSFWGWCDITCLQMQADKLSIVVDYPQGAPMIQRLRIATVRNLINALRGCGMSEDTAVSFNGCSGCRIDAKEDAMFGGKMISIVGSDTEEDNFLVPTDHELMVTEEQRQVMLMALAHLSVERPGWDVMLKEIANKIDIDCTMYEQFKVMHADNVIDLGDGE